MLSDLAIIIIIGIIFFLIDIKTFDYCSSSVYPTLLLHHIVNIYAQFGFLSQDKILLKLYLITPLFVVIHWKTNNNNCILTELVNKECGYNMYFRDIWYFLGLKQCKHYNIIHHVYLIVAWIIAFIRYLQM